MDEITITIQPEDAELLLNLVNQLQVQGKESLQQVLRIMHRLESIIPEKDEDEDQCIGAVIRVSSCRKPILSRQTYCMLI